MDFFSALKYVQETGEPVFYMGDIGVYNTKFEHKAVEYSVDMLKQTSFYKAKKEVEENE